MNFAEELIVPYDQIATHAVRYETIQVASIEHLMVLKLEAYRDRYASTKGQKDAKDIIQLALVANARRGAGLQETLLRAYLREEHLALLSRVHKGPEFLAMAKGNAQLAATMRQTFGRVLKAFLGRK